LSFFPGRSTEDHGRIGGEIISDGGVGSVDGALVFAIQASDENLVESNMGRIAQLPASSAVIAVADEDQARAPYTLRFLEIGVEYVVIVILDTSGDGRYDAGGDRWGFYGRGSGQGQLVLAMGFGSGPFPAPLWRSDVDVALPVP
jgi:hypothetical protein